MIPVLLLNLAAVAVAPFLTNACLAEDSFVLFGFQLATLCPYLMWRTRYLKDLFLPSYFVLVYVAVSLTFGCYLVPRGYGGDGMYEAAVMSVGHYRIVVPYLMLSNIVLFAVADHSLRRLYARDDRRRRPGGGRIRNATWKDVGASVAYLGAFVAVSYLNPFSAFSYQLALMILHLTGISNRRSAVRYGAYAFYIAVMLMVGYQNKREVAITLFLVTFLEASARKAELRFTLRSLAGPLTVAAAFLLLVLTASVLRGYGNFEVTTPAQAVARVPEYVASENFLSGLTDNLELNYSYGAAVTSMSMMLDGRLDMQYGASLAKLFFLPIPRDVLPEKPESVMQIFTREFAPHWQEEGASLPVMSPAELFINFHYGGVLALAIIWFLLDQCFLGLQSAKPRTFSSLSFLFLVITVLLFARGSGIEQYLLYYVLAAPVLWAGAYGIRALHAPLRGRRAVA